MAFVHNSLKEEEMAFAASRKQSIISRRGTIKSTVKDKSVPLTSDEIKSFAADLRQSREDKDLDDLVGL